MELNTLYEYLYELGVILQTENSLVVFETGFRPWPSTMATRVQGWWAKQKFL